MAAAGGESSIITQVQQGGPPINTLSDINADETITMDLRGTRFTLSRDELLTLPEFVLLSLFPNGLFPEGHMGGGFQDGDAVQVDVGTTDSNYYYGNDEGYYGNGAGVVDDDDGGDGDGDLSNPIYQLQQPPGQGNAYGDDDDQHRGASESASDSAMPCATVPVVVADPTSQNASHIRSILRNLEIYIADHYTHTQYDPASLQYMLDFFRGVASSIPATTSEDGSDVVGVDPATQQQRDDSSRRAGIIVLREDLDFYAIPHKQDISQEEMMDVKRAAAKKLLEQGGIFSGLKKSDEPGTTEAHLIEMLTAGGFNHDDHWGHRAGEPNKAVICSLALARLRSDIRGNEMGNNAVGMAQKLLLFWRKPARRCWWEGVELEGVEGVPQGQKLKVWIRRVWTLEMSVIGLR